MKRSGNWIAFCLLTWIVTGCGSAPSNLPPTYKVSGIVTLSGQPLEGATVQFQLTDGTRGAVGLTDDSGRYQLSTFRSGDGAVPGQYQVAITKFSSPPADFPARKSEDEPLLVQFKPQNLLPKKFATTSTSGLTGEVTEKVNEINFSLMP